MIEEIKTIRTGYNCNKFRKNELKNRSKEILTWKYLRWWWIVGGCGCLEAMIHHHRIRHRGWDEDESLDVRAISMCCPTDRPRRSELLRPPNRVIESHDESVERPLKLQPEVHRVIKTGGNLFDPFYHQLEYLLNLIFNNNNKYISRSLTKADTFQWQLFFPYTTGYVLNLGGGGGEGTTCYIIQPLFQWRLRGIDKY